MNQKADLEQGGAVVESSPPSETTPSSSAETCTGSGENENSGTRESTVYFNDEATTSVSSNESDSGGSSSRRPRRTSSILQAQERCNQRRLRHTFVDSAPPPSKQFLPPARYKLWLLVVAAYYLSDWLTYEAGIGQWLQNKVRLSYNGALFVVMAMVVGVLVYGLLDLFNGLVFFKRNGAWVGIATWLRQDRIQWVHQHPNSTLCEILAGIVVILEEGISIFNAPKASSASGVHQPQYFFCESEQQEQKQVVLRIENRIALGKEPDYQAWKDNKLIKQACLDLPGLVDVNAQTFENYINGHLYVVYLKFEHIDYLNQYMVSPVRARIMKHLEPLLAQPDLVQLRKDRILPDAMTDLSHPLGHALTPRVRNPKKWKVWWIQTFGLFLVTLFVNATLQDHYFTVWNFHGDNHVHSDTHARRAVYVVLNTWLNAYIMTPFLVLLFGEWIKRQENDGHPREPWRTLNGGIKTLWGKALLVVVFYGLCVVGWLV